MVNINKLKGKIVENGFTVEELADKTGIPRSRFSRRFSDGGSKFTVGEVKLISDALMLKVEDVNSIFFA